MSKGSGGRRHAAIRISLAQLIARSCPGIRGEAQDIALSTHPWPDVELNEEGRQAVIAELNPRANLPHPDIRQVAADRLLRLADALRENGASPGTVAIYDEAARRLIHASAESPWPARSPTLSLVREPLDFYHGTASPPDRHDAGSHALPHDFEDDLSETLGVIARFVGAVAQTGSLDVGVNLGQIPLRTSLSRVVEALRFEQLVEPVEQWIGGLDPRMQDVLLRRVVALDRKDTLDVVGACWGLTRERVRQLEGKVKELLAEECGELLEALGTSLARLKCAVLPESRFQAATSVILAPIPHGEAVAAAIIWAAGPWTSKNGWVYHKDLTSKLHEIAAEVRSMADVYGLLPDEAPTKFDGLFLSPEDRSVYLRDHLGITMVSGYWSIRDSSRTRVAAALKRLGRPATKTEIISYARLDPDARIGGVLSALPGVVRADKERWAFENWVDDPYSGIVGEIDQRIDANHGSVAIQTLLHELPRKFGVSEASVRAFLQTPAYHIEDGFVRRADPQSYEPSVPARWPDAYRLDGLWGQKTRLEPRHFQGYSLKVRFDIAYANGLRPGCDLKVPVNDSASEASVIWRLHDATHSIDVGRISDSLATQGFSPSELIFIAPSASHIVISRWSAVEPGLRIRSESERANEGRDPLLDLLESP